MRDLLEEGGSSFQMFKSKYFFDFGRLKNCMIEYYLFFDEFYLNLCGIGQINLF